LLYVSGAAPRYPLLVDTSLGTPGSALRDVVISGSLEPVVVAAPQFSVPPGTYTAPQQVAVTVSTPGAVIHYTIGGQDPTLTDPVVVSGATVLVDHSLVLKARAWADGRLPSTVTTATYVINETPGAPTFNPPGGDFAKGIQVRIDCAPGAPPGASVRYRTDGAEPTESDSAVACGGTVSVARTLRLAARVFVGGTPSDTTFGDYSITPRVAAGSGHLVVLRIDGTLWAWGANDAGQLGNGTHESATDPVQISLAAVKAVAAGGRHTLALKEDGTVWAWGANEAGQLGNTTNPEETLPVQVSGLTGVVEIAAGESYSLARLASGTVLAWGDNSVGQLGTGTYTSSPAPVAVANLTNVVQIAAGARHNLARRSDGSVWAWGDNSSGQLGYGSSASSNQAFQVSGLPIMKLIAAGDAHSLAIAADGALWGWGNGTSGQLGWGMEDPINAPAPVRELSCEESNPLVITARLADGGLHHTVGWLDMGGGSSGLASWGREESPVPCQIDEAALSLVTENLVRMSVSGNHNLAVGESGTVWYWEQTPAGPASPVQLTAPGGELRVFPPVFSLPSGVYRSEQTMTITALTPGSVIHYTIDRSVPDQTSATIASGGSVQITRSTQLLAVALKEGRPPSDVRKADYTLKVADPVLAPPPGAFDGPVEVTVTVATPGATLHYSMQGNASETDPLVPPDGRITVTPPAQLSVTAYRDGWEPRGTDGMYRTGVVTPVLTPPGGSFTKPLSVTVTTTTPGAILFYTTDGSLPVLGSPAIVSGGTIRADHGMTLTVWGWREDIGGSDYVTGIYRFALPPPTLLVERVGSPSGAFYLTGATSVAGATVRCTMDGTEPTVLSRICTRPIPVDQTTTVKAKTFSAGWDPSGATQRTLSVTDPVVATPVLSLETGRYPSRRTVRITASTAGSVIHYTTNGADPTETDPIVPPDGAVVIDHSLSLKARAWQSSAESLVACGDYLLSGAVTVGDTVVALKTDGTVWAWGENHYGQVGNGATSLPVTSPTQAYIDSVVAIASGTAHTVALRSDGTAWTWGANTDGQLGIGDTGASFHEPASVGLSDVVAVAAGSDLSVALKADGTVWGWGQAYWAPPDQWEAAFSPRQLATDLRCARIFVGGGAIACVSTSGQTWTGGLYWNFAPWPGQLGLAGFTGDGSLSLVTDGGLKGITLLGDMTLDLPLASVVAADVLLAKQAVPWLTQDSFPYDSRWAATSSRAVASEASPAVAIANSTIVRADGTLWRWGRNTTGQLGDGTTQDRRDPQPVPGFQMFTDPWLLEDSDGDGLTNVVELDLGTDPYLADTNGDGVPDGVSVGIGRDPVSADLDGDGLSNRDEIRLGTDPLKADTDGDGVIDGLDAFPLDPSRWNPGTPQAGDTTPPDIHLVEPSDAVLVSSVP